jgi:hypothetical protein
MRLVKGYFVVSGPDIEPMTFKSRADARDWCKTHHPGAPIKQPIKQIGPGSKTKPSRERPESDEAMSAERSQNAHKQKSCAADARRDRIRARASAQRVSCTVPAK